MPTNYGNFPEELKKLNLWTPWKKVQRKEKVTKVPMNYATCVMADITNPQNWGSFEDAVAGCEKFNLDGIGFVFTLENSVVGVDIDNCVDENGNMNELATDIITQLNSYTEFSPSGLGVHIFIKAGPLAEGNKNDGNLGLECYEDKRYFTVTGNIIPGSPLGVEDRGEEFARVYDNYFVHNKSSKKLTGKEGLKGAQSVTENVKASHAEHVDWGNDWTEEELIDKAKMSKRGEIFEQLYLGNWNNYFETQSQAEIAFANTLAFWTCRDYRKMDNIYRMSRLLREKWDENRNGSTYGQIVLEEAISKCTNIYNKKKRRGNIRDGNGVPKVEHRHEEEKVEFKHTEHSQSNYEPTVSDASGTPPWYELLSSGRLKFYPAILAKYLSKNTHVVYSGGQAYKLEKGVYVLAEDIELDTIVKDHLRDDHCTMYSIRDVRKQWMIECSRNPVRFDEASFAHIINVTNGLYNVYEQKLYPHSAYHHSLIQLNCAYEPDAKCDRFLEFINSVLPPESVMLAQEIAGYCIVPMTLAQKSFILHGQGGTGKSTFINVLESLVGQQNVSNIAWSDLSDRFRTANLQGKLINTFADLPDKALKDVGAFKSMVGEDRVTAERKNKDPFEFLCKARFVFSTNHLPSNHGDTGYSFYRRIIILPFVTQIASEDMDPRLKEKLFKEVDGILLWALSGLQRLIGNNFKFSENVYTQKGLVRYRIESSSVRWFIENNCVFGAGFVIDCQEIFKRYQDSSNADGITPVINQKFIREMEESYGTKVVKTLDGKSRRAIWKGIKFI